MKDIESFEFSRVKLSKDQAPVVQTLDSTIHWITQLVLLVFIRWIVIYRVDSAIHRLNYWGLFADLCFLRNPVLVKPYAAVELIRCFAQCFLFSDVTWEASLALKFVRVYAQKR